MKPILVVVSTFNRRDLTGIALDSIRRNKSSLSNVLIIDDSSADYSLEWLGRWGFPVLRQPANVGVGLAAFWRYKEFIARGYAYLCALDNDVLVSKHFDLEMLRLFCAVDDGKRTVVSGYHSTTQSTYPPKSFSETDYWLATTINGISQFTDRASAERLMPEMENKWDTLWDITISRAVTRIAVPKRSLIQHLGIHGSGVNGVSDDVAVNFVGDTFQV